MITIGALLFCTFAALLAGFIDAIAGGGGLLTVPALLIAGVPPHYALGTNKVSAFVGTSVALGVFARSHLVLWRLALVGVPFSILGSYAGSLLALHLDSALLGKILVALLPLGLIATVLPKKERQSQDAPTGSKLWVLLALSCTLIGMYDGFFGPSTGSFLILALHWILGIGLVHASATAKVFNLGSNFGAMVAFIYNGAVLWPLAISMMLASALGNWIGSRTAVRVGASLVRKVLVGSLSLLFVTLLWRYFIG